MNNIHLVHNIIKISLFITLICSLILLVHNLSIKEKTEKHIFDTWQFPMTMALFLDEFMYHRIYF